MQSEQGCVNCDRRKPICRLTVDSMGQLVRGVVGLLGFLFSFMLGDFFLFVFYLVVSRDADFPLFSVLFFFPLFLARSVLRRSVSRFPFSLFSRISSFSF